MKPFFLDCLQNKYSKNSMEKINRAFIYENMESYFYYAIVREKFCFFAASLMLSSAWPIHTMAEITAQNTNKTRIQSSTPSAQNSIGQALLWDHSNNNIRKSREKDISFHPVSSQNSSSYVPKSPLKTLKSAGIFKRISDRMIRAKSTPTVRGQTIPKNDIGLLIIKGNDVKIELEGKESSQFDVQTTGHTIINKKKTCLVVEGNHQDQIHGKIIIPYGVRVILKGGNIVTSIHNLIADMEIHSGTAEIKGHGKISRLNIHASKAKLNVQGIMGQTMINCAQGDIQLGYISESFEKMEDLELPKSENPKPKKYTQRYSRNSENPYFSSGLRLHQPAIKINVYLAQGRVVLSFPEHATVGYPKDSSSIESFVKHQSKRAAFRIYPYLTPHSSSLILRTIGDKNTPLELGTPEVVDKK